MSILKHCANSIGKKLIQIDVYAGGVAMQKSKLAIASFVLGAVSFIQLFGLEKALVAIIFGAVSIKEIATTKVPGRNYAYAGIILGSLYVLVLTIILVIKGPQMISLLMKLR